MFFSSEAGVKISTKYLNPASMDVFNHCLDRVQKNGSDTQLQLGGGLPPEAVLNPRTGQSPPNNAKKMRFGKQEWK
jgi:hypothetical protein